MFLLPLSVVSHSLNTDARGKAKSAQKQQRVNKAKQSEGEEKKQTQEYVQVSKRPRACSFRQQVLKSLPEPSWGLDGTVHNTQK